MEETNTNQQTPVPGAQNPPVEPAPAVQMSTANNPPDAIPDAAEEIAPSAGAVVESKKAAISPVNAAAAKPGATEKKTGAASKLNSIDLSFRISLTEKVFLARHLAIILKSGTSLLESLKIIREQSKNRMRRVLDDVISKVENGKALNVALSDHKRDFDPLFINMIKVGEKSGSLDQSLQYLAEQLSKDEKLIAKVKSASLYPIIVLITAVGVGGGVSYFILPKLTRLFATFNAKLPLATRILIWISKSIETQGIYWLAAIIAFLVFIWLIMKVRAVKYLWQRITIYIPVAGKLTKSVSLARINLMLSTLLKNGVTVVEALNITAEAISFLPYKNALKVASSEISQGKTISEGIGKADPKSKLFDPTVRAMINVGEKTGSLNDSLLYISEFFEEEVDDITKNMATIMEPILLIIIAVIVAFVAIAIISPMYQILNYINK